MYKCYVEIKLGSLSRSEEDTKEIAGWLVDEFVEGKKRCVVYLKGDLGSGKTTFVRYALERLGINESEFNGSPSFTLINEYRGNVFHIDLYRLNSLEDVEMSGVCEYLQGDGIFFIEWPDHCSYDADIVVEFKQINDTERVINVYSS